MEIKIILNNQDVQVCLIGELDSKAITEHANELDEIVKLADKKLEVDCSELEYISSAGLRVIRLTHLNEDVADIFNMSGFQNIFDIE